MAAPDSAPRDSSVRTGVLLAVSAFLFWGFTPIYYKNIARAAPLEILCHRVLWSAMLLLPFVMYGERVRELLRIVQSPRRWAMVPLTSALLLVNWGVFIYSVSVDRVLESSLGYYINPLVNVLLGMIFLGERLTRFQWTAVAAATVGVAYLSFALGRPSWISLTLAGSFGFYGLLRKLSPMGSLHGLFLEMLAATPFALGLFFHLHGRGETVFITAGDMRLDLLLAAAGIVTATPLLLFTAAARRIPLSLLGFLQYIAPTTLFLVSVIGYGEKFTGDHFIAFVFIWVALAFYSWDAWQRSRVARG